MALVDDLKNALADTFAYYLKAHNYHWNIESPHFSSYHSLLDDIYNDAWGAVDAIAEHIRTLDAYAPGSFSRFAALTSIEDEVNIPDAISMLRKIEADNRKVIASLTTAMKSADEAGKANISNFLQDRIDSHEKFGWMLRATVKA